MESDSGRFLIQIFIILHLSLTGCRALTCYHCTTLKTDDDSSADVIKSIQYMYNGELIHSDPNCGSTPLPSNTMVCSASQVCGAIITDTTGNVRNAGTLHMQLQIRSCLPDLFDIIDACKKIESIDIKGSTSIEDMHVDTKECACNTDYCMSDECIGGTFISGRCVLHWKIGLSTAAAAVVAIFLITICCFCCGCCRRSKPNINGMTLSPVVPATEINVNHAGYDQPQDPNIGQAYSKCILKSI